MGYAHTSLRDFSRRKIDSTTADLQLQKSKAKDKKGQGSAASAVKRKFGQERAKNCRHRQRLETISRALGRKAELATFREQEHNPFPSDHGATEGFHHTTIAPELCQRAPN
jgi:hypothetical protein